VYNKNSEKVKLYKREHYKSAYKNHLNTKLLCSYNITLLKYEELLSSQNYKCAICLEKCASGRRLSVDHDHNTGRVRGLLCLNCNRAIGNFKEDVNSIKNAITYLERYSE